MSATDMATSAAQAGFTGNGLVTAIAVSLAEDPSSNPAAVCDSCLGVPELSVGYWQINLLAHPQYRQSDMTNGLLNAQAAYAISGGGSDWSAWSTYTGGEYQTYWSQAQALAAQVAGTPPSSSGTSSNPPAPAPITLPGGVTIKPGVAAVLGLTVLALITAAVVNS